MQYYILPTNQDLFHHGVLGMKWGIRRYQPYSVVPRKSGETGKYIGSRLGAKQNVRAAYKNAKIASKHINKYERKQHSYNEKRNFIKRNQEYSEDVKQLKLDNLDSKQKAYIDKHKDTYDHYKGVLEKAAQKTLDAESVLGREKVENMIYSRQVMDMVIGGAEGLVTYGIGQKLLLASTGRILINPLLPVSAIGAGAMRKAQNSFNIDDARDKLRNKTLSDGEKASNSSGSEKMLNEIRNTKDMSKYNDKNISSIINKEIKDNNNMIKKIESKNNKTDIDYENLDLLRMDNKDLKEKLKRV